MFVTPDTAARSLSAAPVRSSCRRCNSGVKVGVATPLDGTQVSFFECSLLEPNSARLTPGPEGNNVESGVQMQYIWYEYQELFCSSKTVNFMANFVKKICCAGTFH